MKTLTIEVLQHYLAYGLKFESDLDNPVKDFGNQSIWTLDGICNLLGDYCLITQENNDAYPIASCKPHLYPLSHLTKTITVDGKEIVPIVDLAKIAFPHKEWRLHHNKASSDGWKSPLYFCFTGHSFSAYGDANLHVPCQFLLFQKLAQWHFNFMGLDESLYIDKSTIQ